MDFSLPAFTLWLNSTALSLAIRNAQGVIPLLQTIHILSVAVVIWSALMVDLRVLGVVGRNESGSAIATRFLPPIWWTLIVLLATGMILIIGEPKRTLENYVFQFKMITLIVGILATLGIKHFLTNDADFDHQAQVQTLGAAAKALAILSIVSWVAIIFAGRWIAYVR